MGGEGDGGGWEARGLLYLLLELFRVAVKPRRASYIGQGKTGL